MKLFKTISKVLKSEYAVLLLLGHHYDCAVCRDAAVYDLRQYSEYHFENGNDRDHRHRHHLRHCDGRGSTLSVGGQMAFASVLGHACL